MCQGSKRKTAPTEPQVHKTLKVMCTDALKTEWKTVVVESLKTLPIDEIEPKELVENVLGVLKMSFTGKPTQLGLLANNVPNVQKFDLAKIGTKKMGKDAVVEILNQLAKFSTENQNEIISLIDDIKK